MFPPMYVHYQAVRLTSSMGCHCSTRENESKGCVGLPRKEAATTLVKSRHRVVTHLRKAMRRYCACKMPVHALRAYSSEDWMECCRVAIATPCDDAAVTEGMPLPHRAPSPRAQLSELPCRRYFCCASNPRPMTCAWISAAPSKMLRMRASHSTRLISNSSA